MKQFIAWVCFISVVLFLVGWNPFADKNKTVAVIELRNMMGDWEQVALIYGFAHNEDAANMVVAKNDGQRNQLRHMV